MACFHNPTASVRPSRVFHAFPIICLGPRSRAARRSLLSVLGELCDDDPDLILTLGAVASAVKRISWHVRRASLTSMTGLAVSAGGKAQENAFGEKQKKLDVVAVSPAPSRACPRLRSTVGDVRWFP
jgi:hypothetical protein